MRTGPDLSTAAAVQVDTQIRVNGVLRPHTEWSLEQAISADVPNAVDGGELVAARGRVKWQAANGVRVSNPFLRVAGWPPAPGDRVTIDQVTTAGSQVQTCRVFTGKIDRTPGGISAGNESVIVDDVDLLRRTVNLRPMQYAMPADDNPGSIPSGVQLSAITPVVQALMQCGFNATPPAGKMALATIGAGTLFPVRGNLAATWWASREISTPERTRWGMATHVPLNPDRSVSPAEIYGYWPGAGIVSPAVEPWWFAVDFPRWDQTMVQLVLVFEWDDKVTITMYRSGASILCYLNKTRNDPRPAPLVTLPIPDDDVRVVAKITYTPNLRVEFRHEGDPDKGVTAVGGVPERRVDLAMMRAWQGVVGAMQTAAGKAYDWDYWLRYKPNAIFDIAPRAGYSSLGASLAHPQHHKTALELVKQAASALVACIWIDEDARFHWADVEALNGRPVDLTVQAGRILDLGWDDPSVTYRKVGVTYKEPMIQGGPKSPQPSVIVWRGSGSAFKPGEAVDFWIKPENADVDWVVVDRSIGRDVAGRLNTGRGTACVAAWMEGTEEAGYLHWGDNVELDEIDWQTYHLGYTSKDDAVFRVPASLPGINAARVGDPTPQVCAWGRTERVEVTRWGDELGPDEGGDYAHDAGPWIQTGEHADRLRRFLEPRLTKPHPVITDVGVVADARVQRGDKIRLEDSEVTGLAVEGIVYRIRHTGKPGDYQQSLSLWLTRIDAPKPTYGQEQAYYNSHTYRSLQTLKGGTYAADTANPLR